jgi:hypothetical protein
MNIPTMLTVSIFIFLAYAVFRLTISIRFLIQKRGRVFSSVIGIISSLLIIGVSIFMLIIRFTKFS